VPSVTNATWTWNGEEFVARFVWLCGVEGTANTRLDPAKNPGLERFITDSEARDCPDCRHAQFEGLPVPDGHRPVYAKGPIS